MKKYYLKIGGDTIYMFDGKYWWTSGKEYIKWSVHWAVGKDRLLKYDIKEVTYDELIFYMI